MTNMLPLLTLLASQNFGAQGTVVPNGNLSFQHTRLFGHQDSANAAFLALQAHYFVVENFAVAAGFDFGHAWGVGDGSASFYGVRGGLGYYLAFTDHLGIFPQGELRYGGASYDGPNDQTSNSVSIELSAPVILNHGNFFVGFGPLFMKTLDANYKAGGESVDVPTIPYTIALNSVLGGWF
jgi:hypothetical protein